MSFFGKSNQSLLVILNIILATACTGGSSKESCDSCEVPVDDTLFISSEYGNFESMSRNMSAVRFVILHEDDQTMFSDMNQLIDAFGKYFVVDSYSIESFHLITMASLSLHMEEEGMDLGSMLFPGM